MAFKQFKHVAKHKKSFSDRIHLGLAFRKASEYYCTKVNTIHQNPKLFWRFWRKIMIYWHVRLALAPRLFRVRTKIWYLEISPSRACLISPPHCPYGKQRGSFLELKIWEIVFWATPRCGPPYQLEHWPPKKSWGTFGWTHAGGPSVDSDFWKSLQGDPPL